ncbi:MAG: hypothetical protein IJF53_05670, partial [Clostridia bacterium]|nr:hypothetical protein [Clostridia bacterium]
GDDKRRFIYDRDEIYLSFLVERYFLRLTKKAAIQTMAQIRVSQSNVLLTMSVIDFIVQIIADIPHRITTKPFEDFIETPL